MENTNSSESNNSEQSSEVSSSQNENKARAAPSNSSVRIAPAESSDAAAENRENTAREAKSASSSAPTLARPGFSLRSSLLAPSTFSSSAQPDSSPPKPFTLNPPKLSNPFARVLEEEEKDSNTDVPPKNDSPSKPSTSNSSEAKAVSFVPLAGGRSSGPGLNLPTTFGAAPPTTSFVFGQNLREKVVETPAPSDEVSSSNGCVPASSNGTSSTSSSSAVGKVFGSSEETPKANGTTPAEMLFTSAVKGEVAETTTPSPECEGAVGGAKSLSEAAKEYEESRQVKRKFEAVPVITGEENEFNVLQMNCKLLAYDKASLGWQERGRGTLRLNDPAPPSSTSRLIVRAAGSLRLLLNTQIWAGMCVQRANQKSIRFTAVDSNGEMRIFVVMATVKEIDQLERCLEARVKLVTEVTKRPRLEAAR